jgi:hypothetical protein
LNFDLGFTKSIILTFPPVFGFIPFLLLNAKEVPAYLYEFDKPFWNIFFNFSIEPQDSYAYNASILLICLLRSNLLEMRLRDFFNKSLTSLRWLHSGKPSLTND